MPRCILPCSKAIRQSAPTAATPITDATSITAPGATSRIIVENSMDNLRPPRPPKHWDQRFLVLASHVAGWSKDPSTKVGAIAVRDRRILATGFNGLPSGVADSEHRLANREVRLSMTTHAEMNCIAYAARNGVCLAGATMYVWPLMTCSQCASMLIQADINKVVVPDFVEPQRWQDSFDTARQMFIESGVAVVRIPMKGPINPADSSDDSDELPSPLDLPFHAN
jgi:dCMP deaminase